ncbi:MAG: cobalamin-dependent protein [Desulfosarcina sp.]|nr:cobalamin-dependent protein [Desulfobacterales bacterium]
MRTRIEAILAEWDRHSPTREAYLETARALAALRRPAGLWSQPPRMVTATIDDGWGHGLEIIHALAEAVGVRVEPLGILQTPAAVVAVCRRRCPDLLGLTVLQFDSDDAVRHIVEHLPPATTLIAGGAAYRYDPDFAERTQTPVVARDGAAFLRFLLHYRSPGGH